MDIVTALHDSRFFLPVFKDVRTWKAWEIFLKTLFAIPIQDEQELQLFRECTGLVVPPTSPAKESYCICGRRAGKSFTSAVVACYLACFKDWRKILSAGERGMIFILSVDKFQSRIIRDYVSVVLNASESFKKLIRRETPEEIELRNGVTICIKAASFRSLRGFELLAVLADELCFWRDIETGANPAAEILRSVRPGLMNTNGLLLAISTPYSRSGSLYQAYRDFYGKAEGPLIWKSESTRMNPTLDQAMIQRELEADPEGGKAEWMAEFRSDVSAFIPFELIEAVTIPGRVSLPPMKNIQYFAHTDPSGSRSDSFTLGVSHRSAEGRAVLDCLFEHVPPFNPSDVVSECADILKAYGLHVVAGDRFGAEFVVELFRKCGIVYTPSERTSSEIFLEFLPAIASGRVELLDSKRLRAQLAGLERRTRSAGRDQVAHYVGGHDDAALVACGSLVMAASDPQRDGIPMYVKGGLTTSKEELEAHREKCWLLDKKFVPTLAEQELLDEEELEKKLLEELEEESGKGS